MHRGTMTVSIRRLVRSKFPHDGLQQHAPPDARAAANVLTHCLGTAHRWSAHERLARVRSFQKVARGVDSILMERANASRLLHRRWI